MSTHELPPLRRSRRATPAALYAGSLAPLCILLGALAACGRAVSEAPESAPASAHPSPSAPGEFDASMPPGAEPPREAGAAPTDGGSDERPPDVEPDTFTTGEVDVVSVVRTAAERRAISPLIYGMNAYLSDRAFPPEVLAGVTFLRRGGDRSNAYNWETNTSNGAAQESYRNDMFLASTLARPSVPGELDRVLIEKNLAAGRGTMVPFVLNGYVSGPPATGIPFTTPGWPIEQFFRRVELVKPTPFLPSPDLQDGAVYTDEHIDFLKRQFPGNIYAPGPSQVMIGSDNEPDLYAFNFPMLQRGTGRALQVGGVHVGNALTGAEFTQRFLEFAKRARQMEPNAAIVGPDHYHYDGWTTFHGADRAYTDKGRWYMDDFLAAVSAESGRVGARLLDTWDFHWYPQRMFGGTFAWKLDHATRPMTADEIAAVVQSPRSYWDPDYDEHSWVTDDHLKGPAFILKRLRDRLDAGYPGTKLGVTEYFPGGCAHVSSGLAVADTLGVFGRLGVHVAAMWPHTCDLQFAFGGFMLLRNADGAGLRFDDTSVLAEHPEKAESSLYAASDAASRVTVLVVNKTSAARRFGVRLVHPALTSVDVFQIDAAHPTPTRAETSALTKKNAYAYAAPPMSASLLVFRAQAAPPGR